MTPKDGSCFLRRRRVSAYVLGLSLSACADPVKIDNNKVEPEPEEICAASNEWLPDTPELEMFKPLPHPAGECPFYRGGWQNFLIATQPDADGVPAIRSYPTIDDIFERAKPLGPHRSWLGDIKQAGQREILIDQNGNSIYYGIHVNKAYVDFIDKYRLRTKDAVQNADPNLFFPAGVVEFKSAWQVVEPGMVTDDFITTKASVPTLHYNTATGDMEEDRNNPREVTARLLALHVVYTLPGHPEFVWATFEHVDAQEVATTAPSAPENPRDDDPYNLKDTRVISMADLHLFKGGTPANSGNLSIDRKKLMFDEKGQKFVGQQTSIYRMFPASKSNTTHADDAIFSLNFNVQQLFSDASKDGRLKPNDKRGHYRLVGAVWMDKPKHFKLDFPIQNDLTSPYRNEPDFLKKLKEEGSDSDLSILAGEDRLSSTAMESFTQSPDAFPNCFSCHNTQAITAKGVPLNRDKEGIKLMDPKLLNVSHVLSQFVLEESE
jgi:hypothetical protein